MQWAILYVLSAESAVFISLWACGLVLISEKNTAQVHELSGAAIFIFNSHIESVY
jgi:hypothetical protein